MQHDTPTDKTDSTKLSDTTLLNINLEYLENNNMTDYIFGMIASVEKNYHISSDEIDRIFDENAVHCTEVKHSTSDNSEQLK